MSSSPLAKKQDYLKLIKRTISNTLLHTKREKTYLRPNRFGIEGLKGNFYKGFEINCILDTSGSMQNTFDKVSTSVNNTKVVIAASTKRFINIQKARMEAKQEYSEKLKEIKENQRRELERYRYEAEIAKRAAAEQYRDSVKTAKAM